MMKIYMERTHKMVESRSIGLFINLNTMIIDLYFSIN